MSGELAGSQNKGSTFISLAFIKSGISRFAAGH